MFAPNGVEIVLLIVLVAALVLAGVYLYRRYKAYRANDPFGKIPRDHRSL
jgi:cell division protein FtsL